MNLKTVNVKGIIFFDLDDTLFPTTEFIYNVRTHTFKTLIEEGIRDSIEGMHQKFNIVYKELGSNSEKHYNVLLERYYHLSKREIDRLIAIVLIDYYNYKNTMKPFSNTLKVLKELNNNYVLGIISSGVGVKQWDKIYRLELDHYFHSNDVYITESLNFEKNTQFYNWIFNTYKEKYNTENIYIVGDREDNDIIPAKKAGLKTIRVGSGKYGFDFDKSCADYKIKSIGDLFKINDLN